MGLTIGYWLAVVVALVVWDTVASTAETDADRRLAESLGEQVAELAEAPVLDGNRLALSHLLGRITTVPVIEGMWLYGVDGEALATAGTLRPDDVLVFPIISDGDVAGFLRVSVAERTEPGPGWRALTATVVIWPIVWLALVLGVYQLAKPRRRNVAVADSTPAELIDDDNAVAQAERHRESVKRVQILIRSNDPGLARITADLAATYAAPLPIVAQDHVQMELRSGDDDVFQAICVVLLARRTLDATYRGVIHIGSMRDAALICDLAEPNDLLLTNAAKSALKQSERAILAPLERAAIGTLDDTLNPCFEIIDAAPSHQGLLDRQASRLRGSPTQAPPEPSDD